MSNQVDVNSEKGSNTGKKVFLISMVIALALFGLAVAESVYNANELNKSNIAYLKKGKCEKVGMIQASSIFDNDQYQYKCTNGIMLTLNQDYEIES